MFRQSLIALLFFALALMGGACGKEAAPPQRPTVPPKSERVAMEPSSLPKDASWKDVGRRFRDLEKEREEVLKAMQEKAKANGPSTAK